MSSFCLYFHFLLLCLGLPFSGKSLATITLAHKGLEKRDHCRVPCFKADPVVTIDMSIHLARVIGNPLSLVFPSPQGALLKRANPWCEEIGEFSARPVGPGVELKLSICRWLVELLAHWGTVLSASALFTWNSLSATSTSFF